MSCAAGRAALRALCEEDLVSRSESVGKWFHGLLEERLVPTGGVSDVRGLGMFIGIEFTAADRTLAFVNGCRAEGILLGWTLHHDHIVRLAPPLVTPEDALENAARTMARVLARVMR